MTSNPLTSPQVMVKVKAGGLRLHLVRGLESAEGLPVEPLAVECMTQGIVQQHPILVSSILGACLDRLSHGVNVLIAYSVHAELHQLVVRGSERSVGLDRGANYSLRAGQVANLFEGDGEI